MTAKYDQLINDINRHFAHQLRNLVQDNVHTCDVAGIETSDIVALIATPLLCETAMLCKAAGMSRQNYLELCAGVHKFVATELTRIARIAKHAGAGTA
jgi:hypothetical protein